jgi:hypothetical protein
MLTTVAAEQITETCPAETQNRHQKGPSGPSDAAEADALSDLFPGQQSCGVSGPVAPVIEAVVFDDTETQSRTMANVAFLD